MKYVNDKPLVKYYFFQTNIDYFEIQILFNMK